jgi:phage terminase large subunit
MFLRTTAINKLYHAIKQHDKIVVQGGTYAGKTFGIMAVLIDLAARHPRLRITVTAETLPAVKSGALQQFLQIMEETNRFDLNYFKASTKESSAIRYTFKNGTYIEFVSYDSVGKAKNAGKRDILFINEGNHMRFDIASALMDRTELKVLIDFNPDNEFWAHTEVLTEPNAGFLLLKYTDNEGCPESKVEMLHSRREKAKTSKYWANWCRVYIDGEIGTLQGAVFQDYTLIDTIPPDARLINHGLDFGFEPDPAAGVSLYNWNGSFIADEYLYRTRMSTADYVAACKPLNRDGLILCDHNKMVIDELSKAGLKAFKAYKPPGSIEAGIIKLLERPLYVTSRSVNLIKELRGYIKNENGAFEGDDHAIDAMRYANSRTNTPGGFTA